MKKFAFAALAVLAITGCQGKADVGTPSDAPLPPDNVAGAPAGDPKPTTPSTADTKETPASIPSVPDPTSQASGPTAGGGMAPNGKSGG